MALHPSRRLAQLISPTSMPLTEYPSRGMQQLSSRWFLGEALIRRQVLRLGLCGVTAKFTRFKNGQEQGSLWIEEAKILAFRSLDNISTFNISVLQFIATHEMQEADSRLLGI